MSATTLLVASLALLTACSRHDHGKVVATEVIPPGQPMAPPFEAPTIVRQGTGEPVQVGDFVTLHKFRMDKETGKIIKDGGYGWAWLGFLYNKHTRFYTCAIEKVSCEVDAAMIGMKVGTVFKYDHADTYTVSRYQPGKVPNMNLGDRVGGGGAIPFGDLRAYLSRTSSQRLALRSTVHKMPGYLQAQLLSIDPLIFEGPNNDISLPEKSIWWGGMGGGTSMSVRRDLFKIVKRCPAQLLRRTREVVRRGPILHGEGWIPTQVSWVPRRLWVDEVELLGQCADGSTMSFKLGPLAGSRPDGRPESGPIYQGYWGDWLKKAANDLPLGIRIDPVPEIPPPHKCPPEGCAVP